MNDRRSVIIAEVMAASNRKDIITFWDICVLLEKSTAYRKRFKILFRQFSSRHRSTCCVLISWNVVDGKSVKSCVAYLTKKNKISPSSQAVATARIAPTVCQDQPLTVVSTCQWTSSLERRAHHGIRSMQRRHHWSNAATFLIICRVGDQVSAP